MTVSFSAYSIDSFSSDGCSMYPNGTIHEPNLWAHCCFVHDISYWMGGPKGKREIADEELKLCVAQTTHLTHGEIVELGVRTGGAPYSIWPWRWGFGHSEIRPYSPLTQDELDDISDKVGTVSTEIENWSERLNDEQIRYIRDEFAKMTF